MIELQKHREQEAAEGANRAKKVEPEILELKKQIEALSAKVRDAETSAQAASKTFSFKAAKCIRVCLGLLAALSALTLVGVFIFTFFGEMFYDLSPARLEKAGQVTFCAFLLSFTFGGGWLWAGSARRQATRKVKMQSELTALRSKLKTIEASASTQHLPLSDEDKVLHKKFGGGPDTSSSEYERMLAERQALVTSVLSDHSLRDSNKTRAGVSKALRAASIQSRPLPGGPEPETSANRSTTIKCPVGTNFQFEPEFPYGGDNFHSLNEALEFSMGGRRLSNYAEALDQLLVNGYSFIVVETPELLRVFSKQPTIHVMDQLMHQILLRHFGIPKDMKAVWQPKAEGPSKPVKFAELFVAADLDDDALM